MLKLFRDFDEIVTLRGAFEKSGRHIQAEDLSVLKKAAVLVNSEKIVWVGPQGKIPKEFSRKKVKEISYKNKTLIPGFVECHTHSAFAGSRSEEFEARLRGATYREIAARGGGIKSTVKSVREASLTNLSKLLSQRVKKFARQGVTTLEIKSGYGLSLKSEIALLKAIKSIDSLRTVSTFLGPHAVSPDFLSAQDYIDELCKTFLPEVRRQKLSSRADIFIENGFFSLEQGQKYLECAKSLGFDLTIHSEQLSRCGSAQLGVNVGAKSVDHLIQVNQSDISLLASSETTCVLLPTSDLYMKIAYPPARKLIDEGARVALATDFNPGTAPSQDLSLVGLLARLEMKMSLPEILSAYTVSAAWSLGLEKICGHLHEGFSADFSVLEGSWTDLFYEAGGTPVSEVWAKGKKILTQS